MLRRRFLHHCLTPAALFGPALVHAQPSASAGPALRLAILPHLPAAQLIPRYTLLRRYVERVLASPVDLVGAPDYRQHAQRLREGRYELVVTAPQFVHLALKDGGYVPLASLGRPLSTHVIVPHTSPVQRLAELKGRVVATSDMLSLPSISGISMLERAGLQSGSYTLRHYPNNIAALHAMKLGDADALLIGMTSYTAVSETQRETLRRLATSESVGPGFLLAHRSVEAPRRERLRAAMVGFAESEEGQAFFAQRGIDAAERRRLVPGDIDALRWLEPITRRLLATAVP